MGKTIEYQCLTCRKTLHKRPCEVKVIEERGGYAFCSHVCSSVARKDGGVIRARTQATCIKRYGVDNPGKSPEVRARRRQTTLERYGVAHHWQLHEIRNKTDWNRRNERGHATMKLRGTYGKSKIEDTFYERLCELYSIDDVERQVTPLGTHWPIDFYIKSINTYVQFDGVYWHGLDRPIKVIAEHRSKRDLIIHRKWLTDRNQDIWFKDHHLKLIRITDKQFLKQGYVK